MFAIWGIVMLMETIPAAAQVRTASTNSQQGRAAAPPAAEFGDGEYRLGPEDVIFVFVYKEADVSTTVVIRPDGKISLPLIGELVASGKTALELQDEVQTKLKVFINMPTVNVIVKEVNSPKISVFGEVKKPDMYRIKQKTTVVQAIAMAGGFTEFAKKNKVVVIRQNARGSQKIQINLDSVLDGGKGPAFYLQPGDTVYVQ
jgi:polysaccharide export outer membrane protein